jgi:hypothetical protein
MEVFILTNGQVGLAKSLFLFDHSPCYKKWKEGIRLMDFVGLYKFVSEYSRRLRSSLRLLRSHSRWSSD